MINIVILEDEPIYAGVLKGMLEKGNYIVLETFERTENAKEFIVENDVDVIILDIMLNGEESVPFASEISGLNIPIVFITQFHDTSIYKKTLNIPHSSFLVKPFHWLTLDRTIKLLHDRFRVTYIRDGKKRIIIKPDDILWICVEGNYCFIITKEKKYVFKKSLTQIKKELPADLFVQVHRNYLVPIKDISEVNLKDSYLNINGESIPISRRYKSNIFSELKELF